MNKLTLITLLVLIINCGMMININNKLEQCVDELQHEQLLNERRNKIDQLIITELNNTYCYE